MSVPSYVVVCDSSDRDTWLEARLSGIGASEIAAVLGEDTWTSALELYDRKVFPMEPESEEDEFNSRPWLWVGRRIEDFCASLYAELTGREIRKAGKLLRSLAHPWMLATLDYEVKIADIWCPLEIKNVSAFKSGEWREGPPNKYLLQGHQQSLVTASPLTSFFALIGGNTPVWCDIEADGPTQERIKHHGAQFWERVQKHDPPAPDGSDSAARAIARMYPETLDKTIQLPGTFVEAADELNRMKAERTELNRRIRTIEQEVKTAIKESEYAVMPDGRVWHYREVSKAEHVVAASRYRMLTLSKKPRKTKARGERAVTVSVSDVEPLALPNGTE